MPRTGQSPWGPPVRFGPAGASRADQFIFDLHPDRHELRNQGRVIHLRPKRALVLALLLRRPGLLVGLDELRRTLWGDLQLEWRNGLHQCIRDLRRALSDNARSPKYVVTVPRMGYRFVGELMPATGVPPTESDAPRSLAALTRQPLVAYALGIATVLLVPVSLAVICVLTAG